jgi:hypothetical protein
MGSVQGEQPTAQADRSTARQLLERYFDEEELRSLAFDLEVDYDSLTGEGKAGKARELVAYLERHGRLGELLEVGSALRPDVPWEGTAAAGEEDLSPARAAPPERARGASREGAQVGHSVVITGSQISGQVAVGDGNVQTQTIGTSSAPASPGADRGVLDAILAELQATVAAGAPAGKREAALERLGEFGEALAAPEPDLATMEYVQGWFARQLPDLGEAVSAILAHPAVIGWIESRGDEVAAEYRRRFGP